MLIVEKRVRNETFHTLRALNIRLRELLSELNNRPMKGYGNQTRAERFRILDAPALPAAPYEYAEYRSVRVAPGYQVQYAHHCYSVPHELIGQRLSLKAGQTVIQIWHQGQCVAQHPRSEHEYKHTTNPLHMPVLLSAYTFSVVLPKIKICPLLRKLSCLAIIAPIYIDGHER